MFKNIWVWEIISSSERFSTLTLLTWLRFAVLESLPYPRFTWHMKSKNIYLKLLFFPNFLFSFNLNRNFTPHVCLSFHLLVGWSYFSLSKTIWVGQKLILNSWAWILKPIICQKRCLICFKNFEGQNLSQQILWNILSIFDF